MIKGPEKVYTVNISEQQVECIRIAHRELLDMQQAVKFKQTEISAEREKALLPITGSVNVFSGLISDLKEIIELSERVVYALTLRRRFELIATFDRYQNIKGRYIDGYVYFFSDYDPDFLRTTVQSHLCIARSLFDSDFPDGEWVGVDSRYRFEELLKKGRRVRVRHQPSEIDYHI